MTINADALKRVLSTPHGRKVIWDLLAEGGLYRNPYHPENARQTDFNCGNLNLATRLWADCMSADPDLTAMMIKEQGHYDNRSDTADTSSSGNGTGDRNASGKPDLGNGDFAGELPFGRFDATELGRTDAEEPTGGW